MLPDAVFAAANSFAALAWLVLLLTPGSARWAPRVWFVCGRVVPLLFSVGYVALFAAYWRGEGGFGSPADVRALFDVPGALVAGWLHYLAFDLFVGTWIARRAAAIALPHAVVAPLLLLTFLLGPTGYLAFVLIRAARPRVTR